MPAKSPPADLSLVDNVLVVKAPPEHLRVKGAVAKMALVTQPPASGDLSLMASVRPVKAHPPTPDEHDPPDVSGAVEVLPDVLDIPVGR